MTRQRTGFVFAIAGTRGVAMYFIEHGEVEVRLKTKINPVKTLTDGDYFGGNECFIAEILCSYCKR